MPSGRVRPASVSLPAATDPERSCRSLSRSADPSRIHATSRHPRLPLPPSSRKVGRIERFRRDVVQQRSELLLRLPRWPRTPCGASTRPSAGGSFAAVPTWLTRSTSSALDACFDAQYNHKTWRALGIVRTDARRLYLAYHEGRTGYRHGTWKRKPGVVRTAERVAGTARAYRSQLARCETRFRCRRWYQVWPFCR